MHCLIPVAINLLLPVVFGRGPLSTLGIYLWQTRKYGATMSMNSPSVWLFLSQNAEHLKIAATAVALAVLGGGLFALLSRPGFLRKDANYVWVMLWSCWTCVMLLPCMHERYGYIVEVLLAAMAVADLRLFPFAVCVELCGMSTYGSYLFDLLMFDAVKPVAMIACIAAYAAFSGMLLWRVRRCGISRE